MIKLVLALPIFLVSLVISSCSIVGTSFKEEALELGFDETSVLGSSFRHTTYRNDVSVSGSILHVYIGGDGTPWFQGRYVTRDPTPLNPVMLKLMRLDKAPSIYLGRPCYHQQKMPKNCDASLWTNKRYSKTVIDSMVAALSNYLEEHEYEAVKLFGFSGGGALAMLMAPYVREVDVVVTLAGNLDTDAWALHHGYLPLSGSLNPAKLPALPSKIRQIHLVGALDRNVPILINKPFIDRQKNSLYITNTENNHHCCWEKDWLKVLKNWGR